MADVKCPPSLKKRLADIWLYCDPLSPYHVLGEVIRSVETEDGSAESFDSTLFDTLYRYVVLFGLPEFDLGKRDMSQRAIYNEDNPVWVAVTEELGYSAMGYRVLRADKGYPRRRLCSSRSKSKSSVEQYDKDCALWSIKIGSHPIIKRCVLC